MYHHDSYPSSLTIEELTWLDASTHLELPSPVSKSPSRTAMHTSQSTPASRARDIPRRTPRTTAPLPSNSLPAQGNIRRGSKPHTHLRPVVTPSKPTPSLPIQSNISAAAVPSSMSLPSAHLHSQKALPRPSPVPPLPAPMTHRQLPPLPSLPASSSREWIYRRPKSPVRSLSRTPTTTSTTSAASTSPSSVRSTPVRQRERPQTGYVNHSRSNSQPTTPITPTANTSGFWSSVLRPRSRSERSVPLLKVGQAAQTLVISAPISNPKQSHTRTVSISSTASTGSATTTASSTASSSRPDTPASTYSPPSLYRPSPSGIPIKHQSHHRARRATDASTTSSLKSMPSLSQSCPPHPSKSILTRTSSISTKRSTSTTATSSSSAAAAAVAANKSVKFVEMPTVHYASAGYWDIDILDEVMRFGVLEDDREAEEDINDGREIEEEGREVGIEDMGIDLDSIDLGHPIADINDLNKMRDLLCSTPTPEKEKAKAKGFKKFFIAKSSSSSKSKEEKKQSKKKHEISASRTNLLRPNNGSSPSLFSNGATTLESADSSNTSSPAPSIRSASTNATSRRPSISGPYALGSLPPPSAYQHPSRAATFPLPRAPFSAHHRGRSGSTTSSITSTTTFSNDINPQPLSFLSQPPRQTYTHSHSRSHHHHPKTKHPKAHAGGGVPLRSAPSYESFRSIRSGRSTKSTRSVGTVMSAAARSVRSLGSVKSSASTTGKFRSWLSRLAPASVGGGGGGED